MYPGAFVEAHGHKPAVVMADTSWTQTFAELDINANRLSHLFRARGLQPGDHVALCLENHPRFVEILWGCEYAGLIYTTASTQLTKDELAYIVNDCDARVFITSTRDAEGAAELIDLTPNVDLRLVLDGAVDGYLSYEASLVGRSHEPLPGRVAGADMLYSSGTTGTPKGIVRTIAPIALEERSTRVRNFLLTLFGMTPEKIYLSPAPLYHAAPLRFTMSSLAIGATVVVMSRFDPEAFLANVERFKVTHTQVVPTMLVRLLKLPAAALKSSDISSLETVIHAAAPCPIGVKRKVIEHWGPILHEYYGATEGNGFVYCDTAMWLSHPGTVGTPIDCTIHIVDENNEELPVGEQGTIYFEGGSTFQYHKDPEKTAASRHPKGWTTLGDVGYLDTDNFLYLTDRKAYMIITGGVNVYPQEAENILTMHPAVDDVAVFGVPNEEFGEVVRAVVQPRTMPGSAAEANELAAELIAYCRSRLADVKCPRAVDFRAELPRHPTGKLYKRLLRDEYWEGAGRAI